MSSSLFGIAVGLPHTPSEAASHLRSTLKDLGFRSPPAEHDRNAEYFRFCIHGRGDGGTWIFLEHQDRSCISLAQALAIRTQGALDIVEVSGSDSPRTTQDGDLGFAIAVQGWQCIEDGSLRPSRLEIDEWDSPQQAQGDFYETLSFVLWNSTEGALPPEPDAAETLTVVAPDASQELSQRLQGILADVRAATQVSLEYIEGGLFLRLTLPSGSRLAKVSASELRLLRKEAGGIVPLDGSGGVA